MEIDFDRFGNVLFGLPEIAKSLDHECQAFPRHYPEDDPERPAPSESFIGI